MDVRRWSGGGGGGHHKNVALVWGTNSQQGASPPALLAKRGVQQSDLLEGLQTKIRGLNCDLKRMGDDPDP